MFRVILPTPLGDDDLHIALTDDRAELSMTNGSGVTSTIPSKSLVRTENATIIEATSIAPFPFDAKIVLVQGESQCQATVTVRDSEADIEIIKITSVAYEA